jgi:hypothetical protein
MVFQTAHSESARAAHEIASQLQREDSFRKLLADRMTEDGKAVKSIAESQALRAEERRERQRRGANEQGGEDNVEGGGDGEKRESAFFADGSLDFMA